jgi:thymidylate synthase (FAD)
MSVRLIGITKPVDDLTSADLVSYTARVSNPANQNNTATAPKLLKYLIREKHWSPFEMVHLVMEITTTRDISRQIIRHRSFSFQEFCVSENTLITTLTKSGKSKQVTISDLYKRQQSKQCSEMLVRVYDKTTSLLVAAKIKEVFKTGKKECFELILENGKSIIATKDHKFLTNKGFFRLEDLTTDSFVAVNGVPCYQNKEWLERKKKIAIETGLGVQGIANAANCSYHTIRKWLKIHGLQFSKAEVASYTTIWNKGLPKEMQPKYGKPTPKKTRQKMSDSSTKGTESNLYINGNKSFDTISFRDRVAQVCKGAHLSLLVKQDYKCNVCGTTIDKQNSEVDHIFPVSSHPELAYDEDTNLQTLCKNCHNTKTQSENSSLSVHYSKVKSIKYIGVKETYDMEINHQDHNYVANGIVTHNSQRYAEASNFTTDREPRLQDPKNRQNSIYPDNDIAVPLSIAFENLQKEVVNIAQVNYQKALEMGIAKEQARALLPEGLTETTLYMAGTLRSWIHYIDLRAGNGTQKEHQEIAEKCKNIVLEQFPMLSEYWT